MKWSTLLSKVIFAAGQQQQEQPPPPPPPPGPPLHQQADADLVTPRLSSASAGGDEGGIDAAVGSSPSAAASLARWVPPLPFSSQVKRPFNGLPESNTVVPSQLGCDPLAPAFRVEQWHDRIWIRGTFDRTCLFSVTCLVIRLVDAGFDGYVNV
jgi:hypothetical protein